MNKIIWKDIESTEIKGLMICELPPITKPKMRVQETTIDGVDGSIIEELGYESYDKTITIGLTKGFDIDEVIEYFTGVGDVVFNNEPERYYKARIIDQIDYERLLRFRTATVKFRVQPFKYEYLEGKSILTSSGTENNVNLCNITEASGYEYSSLLPKSTNSDFLVERFDSNNLMYSVKSDGYLMCLTNNITLEPNTTYTLTLTRNDNSGSSYRNFIYDVASDGTYALLSNKIGTGELKITFTTGTSGVIALGLGLGNGSNGATGSFEKIMIQKGTNVSQYVPYGIWVLGNCINEGNYISKPIMKIKGTGTIELIINSNKLFRYTFPTNENEVIIDSQMQDAYLGKILKNRNMSGEFPILEVGTNTIYWTGNIESIEITQKSRWI